MKKIKLEDLKVLETYLRHALNNVWENEGETIAYIEDALAEIKRWKTEEVTTMEDLKGSVGEISRLRKELENGD